MTFKGIVLAAAVLGLTSCQDRNDTSTQEQLPARIELSTLMPYETSQTRELVGRIEQTGIAPLAFEVSGRLVHIAVREGAFVQQGDLIASLDDEPYVLAVQKARTQFNQLSQDLNRRRQLRDERILPQAAFEELQAQTEVARLRLSVAERDLRNTQLLAPFEGRISSRQVELWQSVQAGVPAFNLENSHSVDVGVNIPQSMMLLLNPNYDLQAVAWLPERPDVIIPIHYKEHATQGTSGGGIFRLIFSAQVPDEIDVLTGMSVRVRLSLTSSRNQAQSALWRIPISALMTNSNGEYFVWAFDDKTNQAHSILVQVKEIIRGEVIIDGDGLVADQQIVSVGAHFVREGQLLSQEEEN